MSTKADKGGDYGPSELVAIARQRLLEIEKRSEIARGSFARGAPDVAATRSERMVRVTASRIDITTRFPEGSEALESRRWAGRTTAPEFRSDRRL